VSTQSVFDFQCLPAGASLLFVFLLIVNIACDLSRSWRCIGPACLRRYRSQESMVAECPTSAYAAERPVTASRRHLGAIPALLSTQLERLRARSGVSPARVRPLETVLQLGHRTAHTRTGSDAVAYAFATAGENPFPFRFRIAGGCSMLPNTLTLNGSWPAPDSGLPTVRTGLCCPGPGIASLAVFRTNVPFPGLLFSLPGASI